MKKYKMRKQIIITSFIKWLYEKYIIFKPVSGTDISLSEKESIKLIKEYLKEE